MSRMLPLTEAAWASVRQAVKSGRRTDALRWLRRYLRLPALSVQRRARAEALTGWLYLSLGEYGRARVHLRRALLLSPGRSQWEYWLGRAWAEDPLGSWTRAIRWFRRASRRVPQQPLYRAAWGEALIGAGKRRRGVRLLVQAVRQSPCRAGVLQRLVRGMIQAGRPQLALRLLGQSRFLCHTPAAVRQLEESMRRLRYELACRRQPQRRDLHPFLVMPLRAG